jgi:ribosome maturation factor RimP
MNRTVVQDNSDTKARVTKLLKEVIDGSPVFVVEVDVRGTQGSRVVEVYVDSDDELTVDELARINREVGFLLETEDVIPGRYSLNVSSPGLDRPLSMPRQYRKHIGRPVRVHYAREDCSGNTEVEGDLTAVEDAGIEVTASASDVRSIRFEDIMWAKLLLPW